VQGCLSTRQSTCGPGCSSASPWTASVPGQQWAQPDEVNIAIYNTHRFLFSKDPRQNLKYCFCRLIVSMLGNLLTWMLEGGMRTQEFFFWDHEATTWMLKVPQVSERTFPSPLLHTSTPADFDLLLLFQFPLSPLLLYFFYPPLLLLLLLNIWCQIFIYLTNLYGQYVACRAFSTKYKQRKTFSTLSKY